MQLIFDDVVVQLVESHVLNRQRDTDVRGVLHDLAKRVRGIRTLVRIGDLITVSRDDGGAEERILNIHRSLFKNRHGRNGLEHRTWLQETGNGLHFHRALLDLGTVGGVEIRIRCAGVYLTRASIDDKRGAALDAHALKAILQRGLGGLLKLDVNGNDDILAVHSRRRLVNTARDGSAVGTKLGFVVTGGAGKRFVVPIFKPRDPT